MSAVIDAVVARRSIRRFREEPLSEQDVEVLREAVLRAPSSRGIRPWRFVFVRDRELLGRLSLAKPKWADFIADAPLAVAICADESASDAWIEDCSIAATILQLVAEDLELGSCWVQIRGRVREDGSSSEAWVLRALDLDDTLRVECVIAIGRPAERKPAYDRSALQWDAIEER